MNKWIPAALVIATAFTPILAWVIYTQDTRLIVTWTAGVVAIAYLVTKITKD